MNDSDNLWPGQLPDCDLAVSLRFHVREICAHLASLREEARALVVPDVSASTMHYGLEALVIGIEHALLEHGIQLQTLLRQLWPDSPVLGSRAPDLADTRGDVSRVEPAECIRQARENVLIGIIAALELANSALEHMTRILDASTQAGQSAILGHLEAALAALQTALTSGHMACALAARYHDIVEPEHIARDTQELVLATPLRELSHTRANVLSDCPFCGARLTEEDRTFTGSYCESCRTRWILPS